MIKNRQTGKAAVILPLNNDRKPFVRKGLKRSSAGDLAASHRGKRTVSWLDFFGLLDLINEPN
jgi:hypothetical protein